MKMKSIMLLAVALGCGLVAMLGVQQVLSKNRGDGIERVKVLVARTEIDPGVPLTKENVTFRDIAKDAVPENPVTTPEEFEERALVHRAYTNQVICIPQLGEKGVFGATIDIPHGKRVVTIPVNATTAHSGLMKPGDRVDVLATVTLQRPGMGSITKTKTILEYIEVWATDHTRVGVEEAAKQISSKESVKNVSLLVTPKEAAFLELAKSKGTIHLALRSKTDMARTETNGVDENGLQDFESLFNPPEPEPKEKTESPKPIAKPNFANYLNKPAVEEKIVEVVKPTWKVTIYSGSDKKVEEVDLPLKETPQVTSEVTTSSAQPGTVKWMTAVGGFFGLPVKSN